MFGPTAEATALAIGTIIFGLGAVADAVFLVWYLRVAKWRTSGIGIMFVLMSVANLAAGLAILFGRIFGPDSIWPGYALFRPYFTLIVFIVFAAAMAVKLIVFANVRSQPDEPEQRMGVPSRQNRPDRAAGRILTVVDRIVRGKS